MDTTTSNELISAVGHVVHLKAIYCGSGLAFGVMGLIIFLARINKGGTGSPDKPDRAALSMERGGPGLILAVIGGIIVMLAELGAPSITLHGRNGFQSTASKNRAGETSPAARHVAEQNEGFVPRFHDPSDVQNERKTVREKFVEVEPNKLTDRKAEPGRQSVETKGNNTLRLMPAPPPETKREPNFLTLGRTNNMQRLSNNTFSFEEAQQPQVTNSPTPIKLTRPTGRRIQPSLP